MSKAQDQLIEQFVRELDQLALAYEEDFESHNLAGMLLSRVTLLMTGDPATGKHLLMYVWNKLDELEQSNPGQYL